MQARARRDEVVGMRDGVLVARVTAPPVDGRANRAVVRLVARTLDVPQSRVALLRGARSRDKLIGVEEMSDAELEAGLRRAL